MLSIVWDITPNQVTPNTIPSGTFSPQHPGEESLNCRVANLVFSKARIEYHYIFIGISNRGCVLTVVSRLGKGSCSERSRNCSSDKATTAYSSKSALWILFWFQVGSPPCYSWVKTKLSIHKITTRNKRRVNAGRKGR